ncbi:class I SAM-dependent methyltransferase [Sinorhizobium terangae]|uniref:class I SAM-dependent methyltransferase n=1 Tax=Sinorhizobium terangae TaxID=110322 RepID=UPI0024B0AE2D|nr:methyltransferase domain-containing protein [Sinorhizobium terangae]WFU46187.1 methyltransferase domain-containing protein [Sinorhizobium terangae]
MVTQPTFKTLEHRGWSERARIYDRYSGRFCRYGIAALLNAAGISRGHSTLDVCCGTGEASLAAAARGAIVTGVDFSEEMVAAAKAKASNVHFQVGDAEALIFGDAAFDRVINNFGTLHLADPDRAIAEAARVLKPGGRYAFTVWRGPDVSPLFRILPEVVSSHGTLDVDLPPAPPLFRFAEREEAMRVLHGAGFTDVTFGDIPATLDFPVAELSDFFRHAFVRSTMVLDRQEPAARARIEEALGENFQPFTDNGIVRLPLPALVVSATRD